MPNLSAYINFSVQFDLTGGVPLIHLTDTGSYPAGVAAALKGNFIITQPDGGQSGKLDFTNPNIAWDADNSRLFVYDYLSRAACDGASQNGTWQVIYTIRVDGYDDTVLKKTFYLNFKQPVLAINPDFDVFTPSLKYKDNTNYTVAGFSSSITRAWSVLANEAAITLTGINQDIDLIYNGKYYDSSYQATLTSSIIYTHTTYSWLTIRTSATVNDIACANTPPSCATLMNQLQSFAANIDCACDDLSSDKNYVTASTLLRVINKAMADSNYNGLYENMVRFEKMVLGAYNYTNTGGTINAFIYNCGDIVTVNTGGSSSMTINPPISFKVGDAGYPSAGDKVFADARLYKKIILYFSKGNIILSPTGGAYTYTDDNGDGTGKITMSDNYAFTNTEDIVIGILPNGQ